jgi:restriction system protein
MWMVRAGHGGNYFGEFNEKNIVAIGWDIGDISSIKTVDEIKQLVRKNYPEYSLGKLNISAGQIYRFKEEFNQKDYVLTYNPEERYYLMGKIQSKYEYNTKLIEYPHIRHVEWIGSVQRDDLSTTTKNTLGAISTIFEIQDEAKKELLNLVKGKKIKEDEVTQEEELDILKEDVIEKAREFIKDKISALDWEEMQEFVAGVLRGMGYKTRVSSRGPDRGKDIVASPDGLGLEDPRIKVEVKHRQGQMGTKEIRSFIGGLSGAKGIYVSIGGFSTEAKYEAERASTPVTLVDIDMLVTLIIQYYDNFDIETRTLLPLTKIYWPT